MQQNPKYYKSGD